MRIQRLVCGLGYVTLVAAFGKRLIAQSPPVSSGVYRSIDTASKVVLGELAGDLGDVRGAARFSDGTLVVADGGGFRLIFVDAAGKRKFVLGHAGHDVGQFNFIANVLHIRDTALVWDGAEGRITAVTKSGRIVRWDRVPPPPDQFDKVAQQLMAPAKSIFGRLLDGRFVGAFYGNTFSGHTGTSSDSMILAVATVGHGWTIVAKLLKAESYFFRGKVATHGQQPFGRNGSVAVGERSWFYTDGASYAIEERAPSGEMMRMLRVDRARVAVTAADIQASTQHLLAASDAVRRESLTQALVGLGNPAVAPAYTALMMDATRKLWARRFAVGGVAPVWDVFDLATGHVVGTVTTPADAQVLDIGRDYIVVRLSSDAAPDEVRVYRMTRGE